MKSIKPGRGPSAMGAVGSVIAVIFGIAWISLANQISASSIFMLFGVLFIVIAIVKGIVDFKNATSKNRYSLFDITDDEEEIDPLQQRFGKQEQTQTFQYCPYCGKALDEDYKFCPGCGKQIKN